MGRFRFTETSSITGVMSKTDEDRAKRLAEALRENLRRRKAQARGERLEDNISPSDTKDREKTP
jgi:hypothetical protein